MRSASTFLVAQVGWQSHEVLQSFIDAAESIGDTNGALLLGELQMWWEPSWEHLQALQRLCSPQKFGLRRQQLQSLALNDANCK